ncbi:MAG TPA: PQQ-binding-like beta-propeller repeat protein [Pirellulaceae bacterium]|jgi:outer membrane protein assembly factor BamB|nr:PQQ-binding-like beta-propeller repeat protein [Pirellulaceae bacterium]
MSHEAEELLARLRKERLVSPRRLQELRDKATAKPDEYGPARMVESLRKRGELTEWQGKRLLEDLENANEEVVDLAGEEPVVDLQPDAPVGATRPGADAFSTDPFAGADAFGGLGAGAGAFGAVDAYASPADAAPRRERRKKPKKSQWESPLLLLGTGALALLLIGSGFLVFVLLRGNETEMFDAARSAYRAQSYNQAVELTNRYLGSFPTGEFASQARVMREMASLRAKTDGGGDMTGALKKAQEVLPVIKTEKGFDDEVRGELAMILPAIAEGFSLQAVNAKKTEDAERFVGLADEAMVLVDDPEFLPRKLRETQAGRLEAIGESLKLASRAIERDKRLEDALARMTSAVGEGKIDQAYGVRRELVRDYPGLSTHERLVTAVAAIVAKEQELVQVQPSTLVSTTAPVQEGESQLFSIARVEGKPVEGAPEAVYVAYGRSAAYGVDMQSGKPIWRRYLGAGEERAPVEIEASDAVLLSDTESGAVELVRRSDGAVQWRTPVGESFAQPTVFGDVALIATETGKLHSIGIQDGTPRSMAQFSQPLAAAPGFDGQRPLLYQCGRQTNLYVLNADSLSCREVYYLGHKEGTVHVPPALMRGYVFVAENAGADYSFLHVLVAKNSGLGLEKAQEPIRLEGHVHAPMKIYDRRLVVVTDSGNISFFEVDPAAKSAPVVATTQFTASQRDLARPWSLIYSGTLFVAERRLSRYEVQTSRGQLNRSWIKFEGDVFTGPLAQAGPNAVTMTHRQPGLPSQTVTAIDQASGEPIWRCDVGYGPLALFDPAATGASEPLLFSSLGQAFALPEWNAVPDYLAETANAGVGARGSSFDQAFLRSDQTVVLYGKNNPDRAAIYQQNRDPIMRVTRFALKNGRPTADSILWRDALIVPWSAGQIFALDPTTGMNAALPFQPTLTPGQETIWRRPAASPNDASALFVAESSGNVYRIALQEGASPFLKETVSEKLDGEISGPLAAIGGTVAVPVRSGGAARIDLLADTTLKKSKEVPLSAALAAGPFAVGDLYVVTLVSGEAIAFDAAGEIKWQTGLPAEAVAGDPLLSGEKLLFAFKSGDLVVVERSTGDILSAQKRIEGFERLIAVQGDRVLAATAEGASVILPLEPSEEEAAVSVGSSANSVAEVVAE